MHPFLEVFVDKQKKSLSQSFISVLPVLGSSELLFCYTFRVYINCLYNLVAFKYFCICETVSAYKHSNCTDSSLFWRDYNLHIFHLFIPTQMFPFTYPFILVFFSLLSFYWNLFLNEKDVCLTIVLVLPCNLYKAVLTKFCFLFCKSSEFTFCQSVATTCLPNLMTRVNRFHPVVLSHIFPLSILYFLSSSLILNSHRVMFVLLFFHDYIYDIQLKFLTLVLFLPLEPNVLRITGLQIITLLDVPLKKK